MRYFILFFAVIGLCGSPILAVHQYDDIPQNNPTEIDFNEGDSSATEDFSLEIQSEINSDSAFAVDDELWRQMNLAQEYFAQGVAANQEASWEEAQYYLEKALSVLGDLDVDTVDSGPEAKKYGTLIRQIVADYRLTLLSLGTLPEDASPSVFLEKFSSLQNLGEIKVEGEKKPITYNVPIVYNDRVKKSIIYFQTVAREAFEKYLERSGKYIPMMTKILDEYGVPSDIVFLPIIESGFNCKAYSWARASGPWQFIASTGRMYDLNRNWWYDERRDFVKSTHAAAKFLKHLNEKFDSWELALAAYNGGPGRVGRTIKSQKTRNFWDMRLRKQTEDYVPFYMAATIIAKNPELYGFHINYDDPVTYDEVVIKKCLDLKTVAKAVGHSKDVLEELNPELLRGVTPPGKKSYNLRIPEGTKEKFLKNLPSLKSPRETSWVRHKIRRGETVSSIANKYGVSQYAIFESNNMNRRSRIYAGKSLIVPVPLDGNYSSPKKSKRRPVSSDGNTYIVRRGDNLWDISRSFKTTPAKLRRLNYLGNSSRIYVGQVLKIPGSSRKSSGKTVASKPDINKQPAGESFKYKVKRGDTVWDIAREYGTTTAALRRLNGLSRSARIYIGQTLLVQGSSSNSDDFYLYTVRRGDTLSEIARAFGTTINSLKRLNNIRNASRLSVGMKLKIAR
ncbi:MAG: LysM peptidoglycan-binding domain-containing protein [candidate division Zixibacteria bacterium]|nr:LysM peptidoglycan-binding domain-containing protein [candidate division Zixibacteria bacterium]